MIIYCRYGLIPANYTMKHVTERIRRIISGNSNSTIRRRSHPFDFVQTRKGVLRELMIGQESGNLIGLVSPALGEGIFLALVLHVDSETVDEEITFQKYDVTGRRHPVPDKLPVRDIKGVCQFLH